MIDEILEIIEKYKTSMKDNDYKLAVDNLMKLNEKNEKDNYEKIKLRAEINSYKKKLARLINRYLDISCGYVRLHEERDGIIYDRMLDTNCDCDGSDEFAFTVV